MKQRITLFLLLILVTLGALTVSAASSKSYVGNKSTKVYHISECTYAGKVSSENRVYFSSRSEAERNGYRRCHYCGDDIIESGQNNSSSNDSSIEKPTTTIPVIQPSASDSETTWWNTLLEKYSLLVYTFPAFLIAVGLYFILKYTINQRIEKVCSILMIIFGIVSLPSAILIFSVVYVLGGAIGLIVVGIGELISYIKGCIAAHKRSNIIHVKIPASTNSGNNQTTSTQTISPQSPAQSVSILLWAKTETLCAFSGATININCFMYIWTIFFYVVTRATRDQSFILMVYSYFDQHAAQHTRWFQHCSFPVSAMRTAYRQVRPSLNALKIDPSTDEGKTFLWELVMKNALSDTPYPSITRSKFYEILSLLCTYPYPTTGADVSKERYSIDDCEHINALPDDTQ